MALRSRPPLSVSGRVPCLEYHNALNTTADSKMIKREPIAIVGLTALFPGSADTAGFWNDILNARDLLTDVPSHYWLVDDYYDPDPAAPDKTYGRRGAFLSPIEFDTLEFGLPPAALPAIDSSQLLALIGAKRVLADAANGRVPHVPKDRIGVFLGRAAATSRVDQGDARKRHPGIAGSRRLRSHCGVFHPAPGKYVSRHSVERDRGPHREP